MLSPAFVMAAQASYDGTTDPTLPLPHHDFAGSVRIYMKHVYTTFWARLISTEEDLQEHMLGKSSRMQHTWGEIFATARITHEQTYPGVKSTTAVGLSEGQFWELAQRMVIGFFNGFPDPPFGWLKVVGGDGFGAGGIRVLVSE
ncbi:hypothetical protein N7471_012673 [Penicillium samsonianum]|uniref:uncharacterized protein n=1 Tax=Penicillium samsonianum TaxID=1882272 RepID=UPI0025484881|nr:uncharacterized protein N7471_012673 [Penicillium samsonianum]KAJ6125356.1 hypothetical protein N7471_012673 [Penicillium samsonianum]